MQRPESLSPGNNHTDEHNPPFGVLSPLPLAEQLSLEDLTNQCTYANNNTDDWREDRRFLRQAGAELEMSLALSPDDARAADHFDDFRVYLERIIHNPEAHFDNVSRALTIEAYLTPFQLRQQNVHTLTMRQQMVLRRCLGGIIQKVDDLSVHPIDKRGYRTKVALHLLMTHTNLAYYPTTTRESQSRHPGYATLHHDGYAILDGAKVPIKLRGSKKYEGEYVRSQVCFLPHIKLALDALEKTTGRKLSAGGHNYAQESIALLEREAYGETLYGYERQWIDEMTKQAEQEVRKFHRDKIAVPSEH